MAKPKRPHEEQTLVEDDETVGIEGWVSGIGPDDRSEDVGTFIQSTSIVGGRGHVVEMANPKSCRSWGRPRKEGGGVFLG